MDKTANSTIEVSGSAAVMDKGERIIPVPRSSWIGAMRDSVEISGDIVGPTGAFKEWDRAEN